jgi:hypothetical protein
VLKPEPMKPTPSEAGMRDQGSGDRERALERYSLAAGLTRRGRSQGTGARSCPLTPAI